MKKKCIFRILKLYFIMIFSLRFTSFNVKVKYIYIKLSFSCYCICNFLHYQPGKKKLLCVCVCMCVLLQNSKLHRNKFWVNIILNRKKSEIANRLSCMLMIINGQAAVTTTPILSRMVIVFLSSFSNFRYSTTFTKKVNFFHWVDVNEIVSCHKFEGWTLGDREMSACFFL